MKNITGLCPICGASQNLVSEVQVSEVIICSDCRTRLVVESIDQQSALFSRAPEVEEDWGE